MDKLKRPYSSFLGGSIVLLSGFRLSVGLTVFIANVVKLNAKFIQIALEVTIVGVAESVMPNKQTFVVFDHLEDRF